MPSLFEKTINKKDAIETIAKFLKENNLVMNFKDPNLRVLNENFDSTITDISAEETEKGYFIFVFYKTSKSFSIARTSFIAFKNELVAKKLKEIFKADLSYFDKEKEEQKAKRGRPSKQEQEEANSEVQEE